MSITADSSISATTSSTTTLTTTTTGATTTTAHIPFAAPATSCSVGTSNTLIK